MRLSWWTIALQAVNFLVLVWLLQRFLWRPVRAILERRRGEVDRVMADAAAAREKAEALRRTVESERTALARERERALEQAHAEAMTQRAALLEKAQREADEARAEARRHLEQERQEAVKEIEGRAASLALALASRLLATAGPRPDELLLEQAFARMRAFDAGERLALAPPGADPVRIVTAAPLDDRARRRWRDELIALLGLRQDVAFAEEPALIAGAEIHFSNVVLRHSWREALARALEEMGR
jgi:F-type H+-transporting ATPase subunit b